MGVFSKTSLGSESVYNSGFALTRYIAQKYGEEKLQKITQRLGDLTNFTIDAAFEEVLGKNGNEIYDEWSSFLKKDYNSRIAPVKENLVEGKQLVDKGFGNFYPIYSPDGKFIYFISNASNDYFSLSGLFKYDIETKEVELVQSGVRSTFSFIKGTNKIVYAKLSEDNPKWNNIHDLYTYDLGEEEEKRLTYGLRANTPNVSNSGKQIVFIFQKDGSSNLGIVDIDGKNFRSLTFFNNGEQVYNPKFTLDDKSIVYGYSYHNGRDIEQISVEGSNRKQLLSEKYDERNAFFISENELIYSSDETGIFNLYKINLTSGEKKQLSNVTGGAFMSSQNKDRSLVYAGYTSSGYKIFEIPYDETIKVDPTKKYIYSANPPLKR